LYRIDRIALVASEYDFLEPHEHPKFGVDCAYGTETGIANRLWREFTSSRREVFGLQRSNASHGIEGRFVSGKQ